METEAERQHTKVMFQGDHWQDPLPHQCHLKGGDLEVRRADSNSVCSVWCEERGGGSEVPWPALGLSSKL
jgi:hypothetical protein